MTTKTELSQRVDDAVREYVAARIAAMGKPAHALGTSTDLFAEGVLDSVALTGLIAAVEQATGREIDFLDVDPDALGTLAGIVLELSKAAQPR